MRETNKESKKENIFDGLLREMKKSPFSYKLLKKFSILSICLGVASFLGSYIILSYLAFILGVVAKKDAQKGAIFGIALGTIGMSLSIFDMIRLTTLLGRYDLILVIIVVILSFLLNPSSFSNWKKKK